MKTMKVVLLVAVAIVTAQLALAKTVYKAFVSSADTGPTEGLLHVFAIDGADMQHERVFLRSYGDGHVRIPVAAIYSQGDVYVLDRGPAGDTTSARLLVYSLDGVFQRVLCDDFRDGDHVSSVPLNLVASPNGSWIYVTTDADYNTGRLYQVRISTGAAVCVVKANLDDPRGLAISSDNSTLYVSSKLNGGGGVYLYGARDGSVTSHGKTYAQPFTRSLALDEANGKIYLGLANSSGGGYKVFDLETKTSERTGGQYDVIALEKAGDAFFSMGTDAIIKYVSPTDSSKDVSLYTGWATSFVDSNHKGTFGFHVFSVEEPDESPYLVGHWKLDEAAGTAVFSNAVDGTIPLRSYGLRGGSTGVDGTGLWNPDYSYGVFEGSGAALGANYGVFLWMGFPSGVAGKQYAVLSKRVQDDNQPGQWEISHDASHHLRFVSKSFGSVDMTSSSTSLGDGKWHHVGLVKDGRTLTLYLDGEAVVTKTQISFVDDSVDLVLGSRADLRTLYVPAGTFYDDIRLYRGAPSATDVAALYAEFSAQKDNVPTASPTLPIQDTTLALTYGSIIQKRSPAASTVGRPSVLVTSEDKWFVSTAQQMAPHAVGTQSMVLRSENRGGSWGSESGYPAQYDGALFETTDGGVRLFGRKSNTGNFSQNVMYVNPAEGAAVRDAYGLYDVIAKSTLGDPFVNDIGTIAYRKATPIADTVSFQQMLPGGAVVANGRLYAPYAAGGKQGVLSARITADGLDDWSPTAAVSLSQAETLPVPLAVDGAGEVVPVDVSSVALPGADKPFAVRYDPVKEVYWAVTTPDNTSIALYASQDLATWQFAQTILTVSDPETTKVANPAFDFSGSDLVLAFNLACPDGTTDEILPADRPNFTIARKVGGFRKSCPFKKGLLLIFR